MKTRRYSNMKNLLYILFLFTLLTVISCSNSTDSTDEEHEFAEYSNSSIYPEEFRMFAPSRVCFIDFTNEIENMKAKVAVHDYLFSDSVLVGNAEIIFYQNDSTPSLYFRAPYFGMRGVPVDTIRNSQILRLTYKTPKYDINKPISFDTFRDVPFFFLDVNFDGKKDFVIKNFQLGQRWYDAYQAYDVTNDIDGSYGYDYLYDDLRGVAPYQDLDDLSEIDYTKKEISTYMYGGYSDSRKTIYKYINGKITLHSTEDYDSLGRVLARRQVLKIDTITTYHNNRQNLFN